MHPTDVLSSRASWDGNLGRLFCCAVFPNHPWLIRIPCCMFTWLLNISYTIVFNRLLVKMCLNVSLLLLLENMDHMLYSHCLTWYLAHGRHLNKSTYWTSKWIFSTFLETNLLALVFPLFLPGIQGGGISLFLTWYLLEFPDYSPWEVLLSKTRWNIVSAGTWSIPTGGGWSATSDHGFSW